MTEYFNVINVSVSSKLYKNIYNVYVRCKREVIENSKALSIVVILSILTEKENSWWYKNNRETLGLENKGEK